MFYRKNLLIKKSILFTLIFTILDLSLLLYLIFYSPLHKTKASAIDSRSFSMNAPEINEVTSLKNASFESLSKYFVDLANKKGAKYAMEVLNAVKLPPGTDIHLLGHVVGDILYEQQGTEGIKICTDAFRNACSHSIVIGTLLSKGESSMSYLSEICKKAPGGPGAYTMCFHGLGHGVLGYTEYNLEKAVILCQKTGTDAYNHRESSECIGGAVMEMMAGVHDREMWQKQVGKYLNEENPLSPCDTNIIPLEGKSYCYMYLTPHLLELAGANLINPSPTTFAKAFSFCNALPKSDANRLVCYSSFGKDFTVLANNRDVRTTGTMSKDKLLTAISWCDYAQIEDGVNACLQSALQSLFWGGEVNPQASIEFCSLVDNKFQKMCYKSLAQSITIYINDPKRKKNVCQMLPQEYQGDCKKE